MALEPDLLLDRRRLKRRLTFWRIATLVAVIAAGLAIASPRLGGVPGQSRIARVTIDGLITEDAKLVRAVDRLADDDAVAAVELRVDSPGGTVGGGEALYNAFKRVAAKKPVVTVMGGTAASAAYMISLPSARIFAGGSTLTGSIGVILETGNAGGLLTTLGISTDAIVSGPFKDQPSFTHPLSPQGREYLQALVMDMYGQFVAKVAAGRHMDEAKVRTLADGRAFTGRQAVDLGLIDELGGEMEARTWLAREKKVSADLPVRDVRVGSFWDRNVRAAVEGVWPRALSPLGSPRAMAIWQP